MGNSQDNVEKLRHVYQAWNDTRGGSVRAWLDLMADDVLIHSPGNHACGLDFDAGNRGRDKAEQYFAGLTDAWEMIHFTPVEFIADGDRIVVLSQVAFRSRLTGKVAESPKADFFRFRDGK